MYVQLVNDIIIVYTFFTKATPFNTMSYIAVELVWLVIQSSFHEWFVRNYNDVSTHDLHINSISSLLLELLELFLSIVTYM